jgi:hypothetical protein
MEMEIHVGYTKHSKDKRNKITVGMIAMQKL